MRDTREDQAELKRAMEHIRARLESLFITLTGKETSQELVAMEEAVDRFEVAVESAGGDLMVDEGPTRAISRTTCTSSRRSGRMENRSRATGPDGHGDRPVRHRER
jgi:hypothetical protein